MTTQMSVKMKCHELKQALSSTKPGGGTKDSLVNRKVLATAKEQELEDDEEEEEEEEEVEEEEEEEDEDEEEEEESDQAQGGSSSLHKKPLAPVPEKRPPLQRRFAVDTDGVPIHHPVEPHPPPPAVAAPGPPPTITEEIRVKGDERAPAGGPPGTTGAHRPLQRSATLPANTTVQLANKHRIVHFCNVVSINEEHLLKPIL